MEVAVLAGLFLVFALSASRLERIWVSAPMFFLMCGVLLGPAGVDLLPVAATTEPVRLLAEATLALLLFADASTISFRRAREDRGLPERLLFIGLPLTMVLGAFLGWLLFPGIGLAAAALIAAMVAPTDAALGLQVVTNRAVPVRVRRLLIIESGLNDGLVTPFVLLLLALSVGESVGSPAAFVTDAFTQMGVAAVVAVVVGLGGGWLFARAKEAGWSSASSQDVAVIAMAAIAYAGSVAVGGNGFVAAFLAGIFFGAGRHEVIERPMRFTETTGLFLSYLVWAMFGAAIVGPVLVEGFDLKIVAYAVLSLTVARMLPVALSLIGTGFRRDSVAFVGWFGPRGLASAVFTFIALDAFHEYSAGALAATVTAVVAWTVLLSVVAHGLTATPIARGYARRVAGEEYVEEHREAPEPRTRHRAHRDEEEATDLSAR